MFSFVSRALITFLRNQFEQNSRAALRLHVHLTNRQISALNCHYGRNADIAAGEIEGSEG